MEKVKENDFIQLDFTGRVKDGGYIFDTTSEKVAKDNGLYNPEVNYGPITVCVGKGLVLKGLDKALIGKDLGFDGTLEVTPEDAFGKKDPKMLKLIPSSKFKSNGVNPQPGLQVNVDGTLGFIKTVTGGRTIVDFNHPLAGKELEYDVLIKNKVDDVQEQVESLLTMKLNLKRDNFEVSIDDNKALIKLIGLPSVPDEFTTHMGQFIKDATVVENVEFMTDSNSGGAGEKNSDDVIAEKTSEDDKSQKSD